MMTRFVQLATIMAGAVVTLGAVTACGDDSTASAPITSDPITTTSLYSAVSSSTSAKPSASTPSSASAESLSVPPPAGKPKMPPPAHDGAALPATAPNTHTSVPQNFPGPNGEKPSPKGQAYLAALKSQHVTFMGDTDNSVALTMAEYICREQHKNADPTTIKAFVTASVGPGTKTVEEANSKADKVIKAAHDHYC